MELLKQFEEMEKMPIFEINKADYIEGEDDYFYAYVSADEDGIWCKDIVIEWDDIFSLDEHLGALFEKFIEKMINTNFGELSDDNSTLV